MKNLIFIDNDSKERAMSDMDYAKSMLIHLGGIPEVDVQRMKIISDFGNLEKEKAYDLLFSEKNCICTWSMYTANHYGSLNQLIRFLTAAGRNRIKGMIYVDTSGMIQKTLERELPNIKDPLYLLNAIEVNNIISFHLQDNLCFRLRIEFKGVDDSPFKREEIILSKLLNN